MSGSALLRPWRLRLKRGVEMDFCWIPGGTFLMGARDEYDDEEPRHRVEISRGFYLGRTPVTQKQYEVWTAQEQPPDGPHTNHFAKQSHNPAENVSWNDAMAYCAWLGREHRTRLPAGYVPTLPTEAEWEYACRIAAVAETEDGVCVRTCETEYHTGDGAAALGEAGWYDGNSAGTTKPVGQKVANGAGLRDMHGNVWEWCWDEYDAHAYRTRPDGVVDPGTASRDAWRGGDVDSVAGSGNPGRVIRGGSWFNTAWYCRAAYRVWRRPGNRFRNQGFRVCLVPVRGQTSKQRLEAEPGGTPRRSRRARGTRR